MAQFNLTCRRCGTEFKYRFIWTRSLCQSCVVASDAVGECGYCRDQPAIGVVVDFYHDGSVIGSYKACDDCGDKYAARPSYGSRDDYERPQSIFRPFMVEEDASV